MPQETREARIAELQSLIGAVADPEDTSRQTETLRSLNAAIHADERVSEGLAAEIRRVVGLSQLDTTGQGVAAGAGGV